MKHMPAAQHTDVIIFLHLPLTHVTEYNIRISLQTGIKSQRQIGRELTMLAD